MAHGSRVLTSSTLRGVPSCVVESVGAVALVVDRKNNTFLFELLVQTVNYRKKQYTRLQKSRTRGRNSIANINDTEI